MVYYKENSFKIALFTQIPRSDYTSAAILNLNLKNKNPGHESPGILLKVLKSPGILNSEKRDCKNSIC